MNQPVPPAPSADQQRLALLIEAESMQLGEFLAILEREENLLVAGDIDALVSIANDKNERYRQLQRLHDERTRLLARMGHGISDTAIRKVCANLPRVLARWDEVIERARQARDRNALNGQLILERMSNNQAALTVLLSAANHPQLYDADGLAKPTGGGRILGSA
ncbi:flagella synthesis protein FlgN [Thauera sp.]|uniref:flagella synthesis protein FlgN n=1 Tax=Thauera sp. TaxID=1905334 RepID=UPI0039E22EE2